MQPYPDTLDGDVWLLTSPSTMVRERSYDVLSSIGKTVLENACMSIERKPHTELPDGPVQRLIGLTNIEIYPAGLCSACVPFYSVAEH